MKKGKKRTAVGAFFMYALLTVGSWAFLKSYSTSYNKYSEEKIVPVSIELSGNTASVNVIGHSMKIKEVPPESRLYCIFYFVSPDEVRLSAKLISMIDRI